MWVDRAKEAKQRLHMSNRDISLATNGKLSERDVIRLLNGEYKKPFVDDVLEVGAALKLSPQDLFGETNSVVESVKTAEESSTLKYEVEKLELKVKFLEEQILLQDKIIKLLEKQK